MHPIWLTVDSTSTDEFW